MEETPISELPDDIKIGNELRIKEMQLSHLPDIINEDVVVCEIPFDKRERVFHQFSKCTVAEFRMRENVHKM